MTDSHFAPAALEGSYDSDFSDLLSYYTSCSPNGHDSIDECIYDHISSCTLPAVASKAHFKLSVVLKSGNRLSTRAVAMVDSGATGSFLNRQYAQRKGV